MTVSKQGEIGAGTPLVLFDFDGTLADSLPAVVECYRFATAEVLGAEWPGPDPADVQRVLTSRFSDICAEKAGERTPQLVERFRDRYVGELDAPVTLYPGVRAALEELLERGIAIGIVTNKTRFALDVDLERTGLAELPFAALVSADDTEERKPHPRPLLLGLERTGLTPSRGYYVGDGPHDVAAAHAAGMHGIAVLWGDFPAADLHAAKPWAIAEEPGAIPSLLHPPSTTTSG
jgi:HAD superfamily hydrolase (TIGR01509 family)